MRYCYLISIGVACLLFCTACGSVKEILSEEKLTPAETQMQEIQETEPETVTEIISELLIEETQAEIPSEPETEAEMQSETEKNIIAQIYVNPDAGEEYISLYAEPDADSATLARLYQNDILGVYSLENGWYCVQFDTLEGYVSESNISMTEIIPETGAPTEAPKPEPEPVQQHQKRFWLESSGLFRIDTSLLGMSRSALSQELGIDIPQPQDFPWWHWKNIQNSDVSYDGLDLCFMFRNDILVMIIYDMHTPYTSFSEYGDELRYNAGEIWQNGELFGGVFTVNLPEPVVLEVWYDVYAETGENVLHEVYMTQEINFEN